MVFTVGDEDDGTSNLFLLCEAVHAQLDSMGNVGALHANHRGVDALQEHLGRNIVAGDGQLHEGIAGKHNQSDFVVGEMVHQVLHQQFALFQSRGHHIFCKHRVADVETDDGFNAIAFLVGNL